jgi:hypothetical protein
MMPEQKKYPTVVLSNAGSWTTPEEGLSDNGSCASKASATIGDYQMQVGTWGFGIPVDAVIDEVHWSAKFVKNAPYGTVEARLTIGFSNRSLYAPQVGAAACADASWATEDNITSMRAWTPADFNNDSITVAYWLHVLAASVQRGYVDSCYVRVVYHVPPPPAPQQSFGDGLVWVTQ